MTPADASPPPSLRLHDVALAAVEEICAEAAAGSSSPEDQFLRRAAASVRANNRSLNQALEACLRAPAPGDERLVWLAGQLRMAHVEMLAVALAAAVEDNPLFGRVIAHVQTPLGGSRPTLGLLVSALDRVAPTSGHVLPTILNGPAVRSGLLAVLNDTAPLTERPVPQVATSDSRAHGDAIIVAEYRRAEPRLEQCRIEVARRRRVAPSRVAAKSVTLRWTIEPSGRVHDAEALLAPQTDTEVAACAKRVISEWRGVEAARNLPSSPARALLMTDLPDRPQPRRDVDVGRGMTVTVGRVREDPLFDVKLVAMGHNTVRPSLFYSATRSSRPAASSR